MRQSKNTYSLLYLITSFGKSWLRIQIALQIRQYTTSVKKRYVDDSWYPVTLNEINAYYALCILIGQVKNSNIQLYWTRKAVLETPIFIQTMPFKRFRQISRFLHLSNNETDDSKD
ncbi:hypothetical protein M0802_015404 [Mischocyttarus mexicanus]|nr:hypothetical protein M0802_015404 [Mischocyttarus mexicanus]